MSKNAKLNEFLQNQGFQQQDEHCSLSGSSVEPTKNLIAPLPQYGFLLTEGPDASKFLQGQTTCNLNEVSTTDSRPGAYCTPKGRMVSSFHIAQLDNEQYLMRMRKDIVSSTQQAFAKYMVFSKAEQHIASDNYLAIGLAGQQAADNIEAVFGNKPNHQFHSIHHEGCLAIQLDSDGQLFECWLHTQHLETLWSALSQGLTPQGSRSWDLLNIRLGIGEVCAATVEEFIPQMLNYQVTGRVNFTKGCYTGQEVVARMHYKATPKRRMFRILVDKVEIHANDPLYRPDSEQSIGNIVNAVALDNGKSEALAVITIKDAEAGQALMGENRLQVEVLSLPYAITSGLTSE